MFRNGLPRLVVRHISEGEREEGSLNASDSGTEAIIYLATNSASIAARLGAHRAFSLGRSGLLSLMLLWRSWRDGSPWGGGGVVHSHGRE